MHILGVNYLGFLGVLPLPLEGATEEKEVKLKGSHFLFSAHSFSHAVFRRGLSQETG